MKSIVLSKRVVLTVLVFIFLLNIVLRFPTTPHEIGNDGFMNHSLARYISRDGYASWHTTPLSFFGFGSFTYPAGYQFLLSGISQLTGLSLEISVLLISLVVGIMGALFGFLMSREIFKDDFMALISAFLFSTAPLFLRITNWNASARQLLMVFMPLFVFILLRTDFVKKAEKKNFIGMEKYSTLALIMLVVMGMMHRLAIYLIFVVAAFALSLVLFKMKNTLTIRTGIMDFKQHTRLMFLFLLFWFGIISLFVYMQLNNVGPYNGMNLWYKYQNGFLFSGSGTFTILSNMVIDYGSSFGILSLLGIVGVVTLFRQRSKNFAPVFLISALILLSPLFTIGLYTQILVFIFFFIIISLGIHSLTQNRKLKKAAVPLLALLLVVSASFSIFMVNHWQQTSPSGSDNMTVTEYDTALYSDVYFSPNDTFISNHQVIGNRILSIADIQFLTEDFPYPVIYGWVDKNDAKQEFNLDAIIQNKTPIVVSPLESRIRDDSRRVVLNDVRLTTAILDRYNVEYMIESPRTSGSRKIVESLENCRYKLYDNGNEKIWKL